MHIEFILKLSTPHKYQSNLTFPIELTRKTRTNTIKMMKVCLLLALTFVAGVAGQESASGNEAAPEPYAYAYQTDSHAASEQRDPQGRVTGFYTLTDADGRERRVEYVADEGGFRAKVATNEVGTKSENPADVEVLAAEPTPAQYAAYTTYQAAAPAAAPAPVQTAQYVRQQAVQTVPAVNYARTTGYQQYAYRPASGYYTNGAYGSPFANQAYGGAYGAYGNGYTYAAPGGYSYRSSAVAAPAGYSYGYAPSTYGYVTGGVAPASQYYGYRSSAVVAPATTGTYSYRSSAAYPVAGATYSTTGPAATSSRSVGYQGSSNYLVLQKRDAGKKEEVAEEKKEKSS